MENGNIKHKLCDGNNKRLCKYDCDWCYSRSFASSDKVQCWDWEKNGCDPRYVPLSSGNSFWFICHKCGHSFDIKLNAVKRGNWCSYCSLPPKRLCGKCETCKSKSFASHPKSSFWSSKNKVSPLEVFRCSNKKFWFDCDKCNHDFESNLINITAGNWCQYCAGQKICSRNECMDCYRRTFASSDKAQYWSSRNKVSPREVFLATDQKYWFDCPDCGHEFLQRLDSIKKGKWCRYCRHQDICSDDNCDFCYSISFASNEMNKYWSKKNNNIRPRDVLASSNKPYWFDCPGCGHELYQILGSITNSGCWCKYCESKELCKDNDCNYCYMKSFASHERSKCWNTEKNELSPREIFLGSSKKYHFICDICNHKLYISVGGVARGKWCKYCAHQDLCNNELCKMCLSNSFASHSQVKYWNYKKNKIHPRNILRGSEMMCWFTCEKCGHDFNPRLNFISRGGWCKNCKHKTELKLYNHLISLGYSPVRQVKFDWCKNGATNKHLLFDFIIDNIIIELDGPQHYTQVSNWEEPESIQVRDRYKEERALANGYSIIRIKQEEVWKDLEPWKDLLSNAMTIAKEQSCIVNILVKEKIVDKT